MKTVFLDIETVPTSDALEEFRREHSNTEPDNQVIKRLSLSALGGKILCIAYAIEPPADAAVEVLFGDEPNVIQGFWRVVADAELFVGHNILDFDLRFIYQRSVINQIKPSREIPFSRFRSSPVFDTMHEWTKWGRDFVKLDTLAKSLNIPSPKVEIDGSKVFEYYKAGRQSEIYDYCKRDVETVRRIYRLMTFAPLPKV